jgi:hypothetical protein
VSGTSVSGAFKDRTHPTCFHFMADAPISKLFYNVLGNPRRRIEARDRPW